ncbi:MAG TPA: nuclear transport factor 2 family protein [Candidatus Pelethocola excrementipullorum]|nr:nuclear transport factor 2 family protein [Candidatus Pelethocola excrementipullorum]
MDIEKYWKYTLGQNAEAMRSYFEKGAAIKWHNSNEHFNVEEFIRANCEYPGNWEGEIERIERLGNLIITVVHVYSKDSKLSFHVTSFIEISNDKIILIDEYWGEDGAAPEWRLEKHIGKPIK